MNATPQFDTLIDRRGTDCAKWDKMEALFGVPAEDGLAMWVADMDFRAPQVVLDALHAYVAGGIFGYYGDDMPYREAIAWWMQTRHGWTVDPGAIFSTHGLVNGTAMCLETYTQPGDGIVLFTPVYHAFHKVIKAAGRHVVELEMVAQDGRYTLDFDRYATQMTGGETMLVLCSPHNPGGRVWTRDELDAIAEFARQHNLIVVSDEIHHDLIMPGSPAHIPMTAIEGVSDRLVMMTSSNKTFNLSGNHTGNVIIEDPKLRETFAARMGGLAISPNSFGMVMSQAAYSPEGASWVDALVQYIDGNRQAFDAGINAIPGLSSMPLEATYLSWVDFSGTGMPREEFTRRVEQDAKIAVNHGPTFGQGGENFLRFNIATQRSRVEDAVARMEAAFGDLQ